MKARQYKEREAVARRFGLSTWQHARLGTIRAVNNIVEDVTDAISDRPLDYDENGDSRPKSSDLSPIEDISEIRSIQKDATSPMLKNCPHLTVRTIPQKSEWAREATGFSNSKKTPEWQMNTSPAQGRR